MTKRLVLMAGLLSLTCGLGAAEKQFGVGQLSEFRISGSEVGYVAGVSGLIWTDFQKTTYNGERNGTGSLSYYAYADNRIVDAEKNSKTDSDDYWCPALADVNLLVWGGWAADAGYADEDALANYFRATPKLIVEAKNDVPQWTAAVYGQEGVLDWYKAQTGKDLLSSRVEGVSVLDSTLPDTLVKTFASADRLIKLCVWFETFVWKGSTGVGHCVTCCGYSIDPTAAANSPSRIKALFIIDSDNDMYNGAGGSSAPDMITYCPLQWTGSAYRLSNVFGTTGELWGDAYSLQAKTSPTVNKTSDLSVSSNGGTAGQIASGDIVGAVSVKKATTLYGCVRSGDDVVGSVELTLGKASATKGSKIGGHLTLFGGKKQSLKASENVDLSAGPGAVSLSVAKSSAAATVLIGAKADGTLAFSGSYGSYTLGSAQIGGKQTKTTCFRLPDGFATVIKGGATVNEDYLPDGESVRMNGKKWTVARAATVKYAKDKTTKEYGWIVNNGKDDPKKTNLSGLKLTYTPKSGAFKGSFYVYALLNGKMKKTTASVTGLVVEGVGYGVATVKGIGSYAVEISDPKWSDFGYAGVIVSTADELRRAVRDAASGDTINLRNGTYEIDDSLAVQKSLKLVGESVNGVVISGDERNGLNGLYFGFLSDGSSIDVSVANCTFLRMDVWYGANVTFEKCRQTSIANSEGLLCYAQSDETPATVRAVNCSFRSAVCAMGANASVSIENCAIDQTGTSYWGLYAIEGVMTANASTVVGGSEGVFAFDGSAVTLSNCIIRNADCAVSSFGGSSVTLTGCTIENCDREQNTYEGGTITVR